MSNTLLDLLSASGPGGPVIPPPSTTPIGFSVLPWLYPGNVPSASTMAADSFYGVRGDVMWKDVEATQGVFNWSSPDAFVLAAATRDMKVYPILDTTAPAYQSITGEQFSRPGGGTSAFTAAQANTAFANFCRLAVQRYGPGGAFWAAHGGVTAYPWETVEIWNEPYYGAGFWRNGANPTEYIALLIAAYNAIRTVNQTIQVGIAVNVKYANAAGTILDWTAPVVGNATVKAMTNVFLSSHPYPAPKTANPATDAGVTGPTDYGFGRVATERNLALAAGWGNPRVRITEVGWPSSLGNTVQTQYNVAAVQRVRANWGSFVDAYFHFTPLNTGTYPEEIYAIGSSTDRGTYAAFVALGPGGGGPGPPTLQLGPAAEAVEVGGPVLQLGPPVEAFEA